jgi:biopolymer transport protein ExbD
MKITRARKSKKGRIEIIPMIDVMFFLLVTFMLASLSMQHLSGIAVNLTQGKAENVNTQKQITLTINAQGLVFLQKEEIDLESLKSRLKQVLRGEDKTIIVLCDKDAAQGKVMLAMLAAKAAGAQHFSLITKN